jgi:hypothetical protein
MIPFKWISFEWLLMGQWQMQILAVALAHYSALFNRLTAERPFFQSQNIKPF